MTSFETDLAGFCTGIVEKSEIIDGRFIKKGDKIIGLPSSGVHSNGFTLIRQMGMHDLELSTPTIIYAKQIQQLLDEIPILGMAHITGGGLEENVSRVIPDGLKANIDWNSWKLPDIFSRIMSKGDVPLDEMKRVFNMGIGFVLIVPPECDYGMQIGEVYG
mgnify:FL=1